MSKRTRMRLRGGIVGAWAITAGLVGCGPEVVSDVRLTAWAVPGSHAVTPKDPPRIETSCFSRREGRIFLQAARNETVSCQLVMTAKEGAIPSVSLAAGELRNKTGKLAASAIRMYVPTSIAVGRSPSWLALRPSAEAPSDRVGDVLVPLNAGRGGQPLNLVAGKNTTVWVEVSIEADAAPGVYAAPIEVLSAEDSLAKLELAVRVLPFALPPRPSLPAIVGVDMRALFARHLMQSGRAYVPAGAVQGDPAAGEAASLLAYTFDLLGAHRCSPFLIGLYPSVSLDAAGKLQVNWANYDKTAEPLLGAKGAELDAWLFPVDAEFPPPASYGGANSPAYAEALTQYVQQTLKHFEAKGWMDACFAWTETTAMDGPESPTRVKAFGERIGSRDGAPRLLTSAIPLSMKPFGWLSHEFDEDMLAFAGALAPPAQFYDVKTMQRMRALEKKTWLTSDRPPFSPSMDVAAPIVDARALPWAAFRLAAQAVFLPVVNDWPENVFQRSAMQGDDWLIYPGKAFGVAGPVSSVRLKRLRRGLQDVEYLRLLKDRGDEDTADTIAKALFRYGGTSAYGDHYADGCQWAWAEQPELWDLARKLMAMRLSELSGGEAGTSAEQFARTVEWRRLIDAACKLRVSCEGVRIREAPSGEEGVSQVEFHVVVRNDRPSPVTGALRFGKLPVGWTPVTDALPVTSLANLARARLTLVARAKTIGTNEVGVSYVPILFDGGSAGQVEVRARLTQLTPRRLERPVTLDGNLDEWPPGIRNVAGDFITIGGEDSGVGEGKVSGRAAQQTLVFAAYDEKRLYLAFNCQEDRIATLPATSSSFVEYDGLLPSGQDLLEILIDPTNAGTGQPMDVYHVVVRPTGAVIAKRGVETGSGWGSSRFWPAEVRVSPSRQNGRWIAEVALPLSAFGQAGRSNKRWAINFARYQHRLGEYSSWSGARRYLYNTRTFGNLLWP